MGEIGSDAFAVRFAGTVQVFRFWHVVRPDLVIQRIALYYLYAAGEHYASAACVFCRTENIESTEDIIVYQ